jgi:hypothetical protein
MKTKQDVFLEVGDRTALICDDGPTSSTLMATLEGIDFKCHSAETSDRAIELMAYTSYDLIAVAETFSGSSLKTNMVLRYLSMLPMAQRRHSYVFLVGNSLRTLDAMQAYTESVHLVVNAADLPNLGAILKRGLAEFDLFYRTYKFVLTEVEKIS